MKILLMQLIKSLEEINTNHIDLIILAVPPKQTLELFNNTRLPMEYKDNYY